MSSKIKTCPFCGGEGYILSHPHGWNDGDEKDRDYLVKCHSCAAEGPQARNEENAVTFWNTRRLV
jgi:Lar family restriction alleviation protein